MTRTAVSVDIPTTDHVHTHRVTVLAVQAAGWGRLYPESGEPWQPGALYLATHPDSAARTEGHATAVAQKLDAVMAHRSEVERGALPGRLAALAPPQRARLMSTEWYIHHGDGQPP